MRLVGLGFVGLVGLVGACAYTPGSYQYPGHAFGGTRETVGCLDLAVERRNDYDGSPVISYEFGNRCNDAAMVDLAYAHVFARTDTGDEVALVPYDPKSEMRPMRLDGRSFGSESIAYSAEGGATVAAVCVDIATIAHAPGTKIVCMASKAPAAPATPAVDPIDPYDPPPAVTQSVDDEDPT